MCETTNLFYDTAFSSEQLYGNIPYRNIGDMLVTRCVSVKNALKLCGAESRITRNEASDYEKFYALCYCMNSLIMHPVYHGIEYILRNIFDIDTVPSPYNAEELWEILNAKIDEMSLSPVSLLKKMNTESICIRKDPFEIFPDFEGSEIDIYKITDLKDIISVIEGCKCDSIISFLNTISKNDTVRFTLKSNYKYIRNSKKAELEAAFDNVKREKSVSEEDKNALISYICYNAAKICKENGLNLIIECKCNENEIENLFSYISLNKSLPDSTALICDNVKNYEDTLIKHTYRNNFGSPSIVPICKSYNELAEVFPIGHTLEYQGNVTDIVSAVSVICNRASLQFSEEITENIIYTNIKNKMKI